MFENKKHPAISNQYRPDIDGLRGLAILSVVLYHAGTPFINGGFIGVDIFFVISGYLITGILLREIANSDFSLANFYLRRAKRILPALTVVMLVTWLLGYWLMLPDEFSDLGQQIGYSTIFIVNIFFEREQASYFHTAAELKPLLHLWSLSIEEQFYLFWPLLLILAVRLTKNVRWLVTVVLLLSFLASCWALLNGNAKAAFYLLPFRAWELAVGAWIATLQTGNRIKEVSAIPAIRHVASMLGTVLIAIGIATLEKTSPFPGWNALWPTIGAAMLIWAGA